jgi:hypothetical protein
MPADHEIDPVLGVTLVRAWGELTTDDLRGVRERVVADPRFRRDHPLVVDLGEVTGIRFPASVVREIARAHTGCPGARAAFVARSTAMVGMVRMYQIVAQLDAARSRIVTDLAGARAWLGAAPPGGAGP